MIRSKDDIAHLHQELVQLREVRQDSVQVFGGTDASKLTDETEQVDAALDFQIEEIENMLRDHKQ